MRGFAGSETGAPFDSNAEREKILHPLRSVTALESAFIRG